MKKRNLKCCGNCTHYLTQLREYFELDNPIPKVYVDHRCGKLETSRSHAKKPDRILPHEYCRKWVWDTRLKWGRAI